MPKVQINFPMRTGMIGATGLEPAAELEQFPHAAGHVVEQGAPVTEVPTVLLGEVPSARRGTAGTSEQTISVSWLNSSDGTGWVQLALEGDVDYFKFVQEFPDADSTSERTTAYTPVLDRQEINRLIKALRRARDAAYGRDE